MPYTYTPNVPQAETPMNQTQPQILENFQAISELIAINHIGFNKDGVGFHNVVEMPYHAIPTTPEPSGISMFTAADSTPPASGPQIFGQYPTGNVFQISGAQSSTSGTGYCQFPSGIIMKWGTGSTTTSSVTVRYPTGVGIPVFITAVPFVQVTFTSVIPGSLTYPNTYLAVSSPTQFNFTGTNYPQTSASFSYSWFSIGA